MTTFAEDAPRRPSPAHFKGHDEAQHLVALQNEAGELATAYAATFASAGDLPSEFHTTWKTYHAAINEIGSLTQQVCNPLVGKSRQFSIMAQLQEKSIFLEEQAIPLLEKTLEGAALSPHAEEFLETCRNNAVHTAEGISCFLEAIHSKRHR